MTKVFIEAMQSANTTILTTPSCIAFDLVKTPEGATFAWLDTTAPAKKARKELRDTLQQMWQSGAFNYEQIASGLRLSEQQVQALMDEEFITKYSL